MRLCAAQTRPVKGDIPANIEGHLRLLDLAIENQADVVVFPELSLTGYEPELAQELATHPDDTRLDVFQAFSDAHTVTIGVGLPTASTVGIRISLVQFHPHSPRQTYSKSYLHEDEIPFFIPGRRPNPSAFIAQNPKTALAICYELSVPDHARTASQLGAEVYLVSAVKDIDATEAAIEQLTAIAGTYRMQVLFANSVGQSGGYACGGKSSAWNAKGQRVGQLNDTAEGIVLYDTDTGGVICKQALVNTHDA